jgi:hypothetical protein
LEESSWKEKLIISRQDFEAGTDGSVLFTASIPKSGNAIIKIAEGDTSRTETSVHYVYSWREWDLIKNRDIPFIRLSPIHTKTLKTSRFNQSLAKW